MNILLVGGFGFIGRKFIEKFSNDYNLIVYAKDDVTLNSKNKLPKNIIIETGRIEEEKTSHIIKKYKPDIVIHLAAVTGLTICEEDPAEAFKVNVFGTFNLVRSCIATGSRLIFASSFEVYGKTQKHECEENDPLNPVNTYALTKLLAEELVKSAGRIHNLDYTILRISNVYGPNYNRGINTMIKGAMKENIIRINGVNRFRNFLYVDDVVQFLNSVINDKRCTKEIYNIGSNDTLTLKEIAYKISHLLKSKVKFEYLPELEIEADYRPSLKKSTSLDYTQKTSIDEGLMKTINWYLDNSSEI